MLGSGTNLVTTIIGFGMSATFIVFVCTRIICGRLRGSVGSRALFEIEARTDIEQPEHHVNAAEPVLVAAIPTMKFNQEAFSAIEDTQCVICLAEYKEREVLRIMPKCGHSFHLSCIDMWLRKQSTCPVCRLPLQNSSETKHVRPVSVTFSMGQSLEESQSSEGNTGSESHVEPIPSNSLQPTSGESLTEPNSFRRTSGESHIEPIPSSSLQPTSGESLTEPNSFRRTSGESHIEPIPSNSLQPTSGESHIEPIPSNSLQPTSGESHIEPIPRNSLQPTSGESLTEPNSFRRTSGESHIEPIPSNSLQPTSGESHIEPIPCNSLQPTSGESLTEPNSFRRTSGESLTERNSFRRTSGESHIEPIPSNSLQQTS